MISLNKINIVKTTDFKTLKRNEIQTSFKQLISNIDTKMYYSQMRLQIPLAAAAGFCSTSSFVVLHLQDPRFALRSNVHLQQRAD